MSETRPPLHIVMPDVEPPQATLCWKQEIEDGVILTFKRCDRRAGHAGPHVWMISYLTQACRAFLAADPGDGYTEAEQAALALMRQALAKIDQAAPPAAAPR